MACFWGNLQRTACSEPSESPFMGAGLNDYGQLGLGHKDPISTFTAIPLENVVQVSVGYGFTLALDEDGVLYGAGRNDYNQLTSALPSEGVTTFTQIRTNVMMVVCGFFGHRALLVDGAWREAGYTPQYAGLWPSPEPLPPVQLFGYEPSIPATAANPPTKMLSDGVSHGSIPLVDPLTQGLRKVTSTSTTSLADPLDDAAYYQSMFSNRVYDVESMSQLIGPMRGDFFSVSFQHPTSLGYKVPQASVDIHHVFAGGGDAVFFTTETGDLYGANDNRSGQLGTGVKTDSTAAWESLGAECETVIVERNITFIKKQDGVWYAAGRNVYGSMGLGDTDERLTFTPIGEFHDLQAGTTDTLVLKDQRGLLLPSNYPGS